jgi:hypothetical protein
VALMRTAQDILFDVTGQTIYFDCPEGRPSSVVSCDVYRWDIADTDTAESAVGSPSVETSPSASISAASGYGQPNPHVLNVTATDGVSVGRTFQVASASGHKEWFEVAGFEDGTSITARHPLHNAYVADDAVVSTRIQATIDSTWVADDGNITTDSVGPNPMYRVRWVYVVAGVTYVADSYFNLVRYSARHGVLPQDIETMLPGWLDWLPTDHRTSQGRRLIDDAYRGVRMDLHQIDLAASSIAESEVVDELVRYKAIELGETAKFLRGDGDGMRVELSTKRYRERLDSMLRIVSRVPVRDESGAATPILSMGLTRR